MPGAGELAGWAAGELGDFGAQMALGEAFSLIGLGGTTDDSAVLADIEDKLSTISTQLDQVNTHLNEITTDLQALAVQLDVSTKEVIANASDLSLRSTYGEIEDRFGSRAYSSPGNIFGVLQIRKTASHAQRAAIAQTASGFVTPDSVASYWSLIRRVGTPLTVRAGLTDPLITQWATFLIAEMNAKLPNVDFESYARLFQSWFMEAVSHQVKIFTLVRFAAAKDTQATQAARARMLSFMQRQCDLYLGQVERLTLSVIRPAPSGLTLEPNRRAAIPKGCQSALLRADILCRSLTTTFESHPYVKPAERISGCYGRVLYRPSDLGSTEAPVIPPQIYSIDSALWGWQNLKISPTLSPPAQPNLGQKLEAGYVPAFATLGPSAEFGCVDWTPSRDAYARLLREDQALMRFARYYWPVPNYFNLSVPFASGGGSQRQAALANSFARLQLGRREGSLIGYYDLANLKFLPANSDGTYGQNLKPDPANPLPMIVSWLDCWSSTSAGARYIDDAPFGFDTVAYSGEPKMSASELSCSTSGNKHALEFDPTPTLKLQQQKMPLQKQTFPYSFTLRQTMSMQWGIDNLWDGGSRGGSAENRVLLFTTRAGESGRMLLFLTADLLITRLLAWEHIWCETSCSIYIDTEPTSSPKLLYSSDPTIDLREDWTYMTKRTRIVLDFVDLGVLQPSQKYVLRFVANMSASCDWDHGVFSNMPRFGRNGHILDSMGITVNDFALARPAGAGYKTIA